MPRLAITIEDRETILDTDNLMLQELEVLEEHAGVDIDTLNDAASLKSIRMIANLLWIVRLRTVAAEQSIPIVQAAALCPRDTFDVAVGTLNIRTVTAPKDHQAATTTTRTRRTASRTPRAQSAKSTKPKSESSPSS